LEVDDGDNTDRASVEVVEQVDEEETPTTATPEPDTPTPTPTATPEPDTPTPTEEPADDTETDTPSTDAGTPGFGIVVALTALIAAALLAVRRTN
jgi:PGF-CTERM protein